MKHDWEEDGRALTSSPNSELARRAALHPGFKHACKRCGYEELTGQPNREDCPSDRDLLIRFIEAFKKDTGGPISLGGMEDHELAEILKHLMAVGSCALHRPSTEGADPSEWECNCLESQRMRQLVARHSSDGPG